jgi:hypothetical protein
MLVAEMISRKTSEIAGDPASVGYEMLSSEMFNP